MLITSGPVPVYLFCSSSDDFDTDEQLFSRTAYYLVTLVVVHNFLCICTMLIVIQPKIYEFYCTLTQRVGVAGIFFFISFESNVDSDLPELYTNFFQQF